MPMLLDLIAPGPLEKGEVESMSQSFATIRSSSLDKLSGPYEYEPTAFTIAKACMEFATLVVQIFAALLYMIVRELRLLRQEIINVKHSL